VVDVVVVGDCEMDEAAEAVLGAAREALLNAAKHAGEHGPIRVYAEVEDARIEAFVRDRGPGFDPAGVPADRRGVRESIIGRMERVGGRAEVHSAPGGGTEVGLEIERTHAGPEAEHR
jgi:signal transduction histidine kinase